MHTTYCWKAASRVYGFDTADVRKRIISFHDHLMAILFYPQTADYKSLPDYCQ